MKRRSGRPEGYRVAVFGRGAKSTYDLPPEVVEQLRLARRLWNATVQRFRDLDDQCNRVKAEGGDHKAFRKAFVAAHGRPDDAAWANGYRRSLGLGAAVAAEVMKHAAEANDRVVKARMRGVPAALKPRDFDGEGTTYKQVQGTDHGGVAIERIESARRGGFWIERSCKRDARGNPTDVPGDDAVFHLTVYPAVRLSIPVPDYFREQSNGKNRIPPGSIVTAVRVSRRREGRHFRVSVAVTYWTPEAVPPPDAPPLVLVVGWAGEGGAVRVANVSGALVPPTVPPAALLAEGWVFPDGDGGYDIELPRFIRKRMEHTESIRSYRDDELNRVRPLLAEVTGRPQWAAAVRKPERVNGPVRALGLPAEHDLEKWRREDAHHWDYEAGQRGQLTNRRRDAWRKVAAWLASQGRPVLVRKPAVAAIRREKPTDGYAAEGGRRNIQQAAPAELVQLVESACQLRGVPLVKKEDEG